MKEIFKKEINPEESISVNPENPNLKTFRTARGTLVELDTSVESFFGLPFSVGDSFEENKMRESCAIVGRKGDDIYFYANGRNGVSVCENCKTLEDFAKIGLTPTEIAEEASYKRAA